MAIRQISVMGLFLVLTTHGVVGSETTTFTILTKTIGPGGNISYDDTPSNNGSKVSSPKDMHVLGCRLKTESPYIYEEIRMLLDAKVKLIEYK